MSQANLDLSGIARNKPRIPEPIADALAELQTAHNDTDTKLTNVTTGHDHDGINSKRLSAVCCKLYHSQATISIPNTAYTPIEWDSEAIDTSAMHESVTNPSRITVPTAGKYLVTLRTSWAPAIATPNDRYQYIKKNNTTSYGLVGSVAPSSASNGAIVITSTILDLAANDYLVAYIYQNTGAASNTIGGAEYDSTFEIVRLGS